MIRLFSFSQILPEIGGANRCFYWVKVAAGPPLMSKKHSNAHPGGWVHVMLAIGSEFRNLLVLLGIGCISGGLVALGAGGGWAGWQVMAGERVAHV